MNLMPTTWKEPQRPGFFWNQGCSTDCPCSALFVGLSRLPFVVPALPVGVSALSGGRTCHVPPGAPREHLLPSFSVHGGLFPADPKRHKLKSEHRQRRSVRLFIWRKKHKCRLGKQSKDRWDWIQQDGESTAAFKFTNSSPPYSPGSGAPHPGLQGISGWCGSHGGFYEAAERRVGGHVCGGPAGGTRGRKSAA